MIKVTFKEVQNLQCNITGLFFECLFVYCDNSIEDNYLGEISLSNIQSIEHVKPTEI